MFALLSVALALPVPQLSSDTLAKFHEPRAVLEALKAKQTQHSDHRTLALVAEQSGSETGAGLNAKIMGELGMAQKAMAKELKDEPQLRMEEEGLLRRAMDKAHAAADMQYLGKKQLALTQKAKVAVKAKSSAELKADAVAALQKYTVGMEKEVKGEKKLYHETKSVEAKVAELNIPEGVKSEAESALAQVTAIEKREVKAAKKAVKDAKKLRGRA